MTHSLLYSCYILWFVTEDTFKKLRLQGYYRLFMIFLSNIIGVNDFSDLHTHLMNLYTCINRREMKTEYLNNE